MKQTISTMQKRPLLTYAISKLNPVIFSHPVWIRFGKKCEPIQQEALQKLFSQAEHLQRDDPGDACQIMFICAVYQNQAGRQDHALSITQQAWAVAKRNNLAKEAIWALWGACALCFQQKNFEQAAQYLEELEAALTKQNDWVLADFVNVIKQAICQPEIVSTWRQADMCDEPSSSDLVHFTSLCLQRWGHSFQAPETDGRSKWGSWYAPGIFHKWRKRWNDSTNRGRQIFVWQSLRSLLRLQQYDRKVELQTGIEEIPQKPRGFVPEPDFAVRNQDPVIDDSHPEITPAKTMPISKRKSSSRKKTSRISLTVQMLGPFRMTIQDSSPKLPASRALSVFKYLLLHYKQSTPRDVLMDLFWPDAEPDAARNNLNVAIHNLRQALQKVTDVTVICFEEGAYHVASNLEIWLDVEEFDHCIREGRQSEAVNQPTAARSEYEIAINLYQGDLLADSPYEEWLVLERERLRVAYLDTLDRLSQIHFSQEQYAACVTLCQMILNRDICREDVHYRVMRCYSRLGQDSLALRQYQVCVEALNEELDVEPAPETMRLYHCIRHRESV